MPIIRCSFISTLIIIDILLISASYIYIFMFIDQPRSSSSVKKNPLMLIHVYMIRICPHNHFVKPHSQKDFAGAALPVGLWAKGSSIDLHQGKAINHSKQLQAVWLQNPSLNMVQLICVCSQRLALTLTYPDRDKLLGECRLFVQEYNVCKPRSYINSNLFVPLKEVANHGFCQI